MELGKETREVKVHVDNLTKRFGDLLVLDQISFAVSYTHLTLPTN